MESRIERVGFYRFPINLKATKAFFDKKNVMGSDRSPKKPSLQFWPKQKALVKPHPDRVY